MQRLREVQFPMIAQSLGNSLVDLLMRELLSVLYDLGNDGGLISPSIYDTALKLRLVPCQESMNLTLSWLIEQQKPDGGWGDPLLPLYRDIPSLAAILTLRQYAEFPKAVESYQAGLNFLKINSYCWQLENFDNIPIASELIIPRFLEECQAVGISLSAEPYAEIITIGHHKRQAIQKLITQSSLKSGDAVLYNWELWGTDPDPSLIDQLGSCGTSPASSAAWLHAAVNRSNLANIRSKVQNYLNQSSANTKSGVPGVVPLVWPLEVFEICWSLEALLVTQLLHHPVLERVVLHRSREVANLMQPDGWSFNSQFTPDGDDTATATAALFAIGLPVDISILEKFERDGVFVTYVGERNPSISVTARGIRVLAMTGKEPSEIAIKTLLSFRSADGRWRDKWHSSWLYATLQCLLALLHAGHYQSLEITIKAYLSYQNADGGWGEANRSTAEETAYGMIALLNLAYFGYTSEANELALRRGFSWLLEHYNPCNWSRNPPLYISKELYTPYRATHAYILSAMLAAALKNQEL
jgi:hypothetical protein